MKRILLGGCMVTLLGLTAPAPAQDCGGPCVLPQFTYRPAVWNRGIPPGYNGTTWGVGIPPGYTPTYWGRAHFDCAGHPGGTVIGAPALPVAPGVKQELLPTPRPEEKIGPPMK
ncbi:MAG: hypothetical protein K2R98_19290 [Gemmataceae bacterium]|nr:hypothetical protein [Gemmataceae bacterium]